MFLVNLLVLDVLLFHDACHRLIVGLLLRARRAVSFGGNRAVVDTWGQRTGITMDRSWMGTQPWPEKTSKYKLLIQSSRRPLSVDQFHMV
jgi:hypothetical protein